MIYYYSRDYSSLFGFEKRLWRGEVCAGSCVAAEQEAAAGDQPQGEGISLAWLRLRFPGAAPAQWEALALFWDQGSVFVSLPNRSVRRRGLSRGAASTLLFKKKKLRGKVRKRSVKKRASVCFVQRSVRLFYRELKTFHYCSTAAF